MSSPKTPLRHKQLQQVLKLPASPFMKQIGFGTGVAVYEFRRSPVCNREQSPWAIKKLIQRKPRGKSNQNELEERLTTEAEILRQLKHPNIVGFRATAKSSDGKTVLAMEECSSCLGDMIENRYEKEMGPFSPEIITKVSSDVAKALDYLHNTSLLMHCDIKSYNVLIKGNFEICKLCDFGVALPVMRNTGALDKRKAGKDVEFAGTEAWSAPELLNYPPVITTKADIYAFGLLIWEMIALVPPIDDDFANHLNDDTCLDESVENQYIRKRPPLPDRDFSDDYTPILEVFYCCTHEERDHRPNAQDLLVLFDDIAKRY